MFDRRDLTKFTFGDQTGAATKEFRNDYTFDKLDRLTKVVQDVSSSDTSWVVDAARKKDVTLEYYVNCGVAGARSRRGHPMCVDDLDVWLASIGQFCKRRESTPVRRRTTGTQPIVFGTLIAVDSCVLEI